MYEHQVKPQVWEAKGPIVVVEEDVRESVEVDEACKGVELVGGDDGYDGELKGRKRRCDDERLAGQERGKRCRRS